MKENMPEEVPWFVVGERDCWPFVRIVIVAAALGAAAHYRLGWTIDARRLAAAPGQVLGVVSLLAMISFALAELYLLVFAVPLYVAGVLNDWSYRASRWLCRALGIRSRALLAILGLCGEIAIFGAALCLLNARLLRP